MFQRNVLRLNKYNMIPDKSDIVNRLDDNDDLVDIMISIEDYLDRSDIYAFKNWEIGELVAGPEIGKYKVACTFMWPKKYMPDPRGACRLLPFDCDVKYKKTQMKVPIKIEGARDVVSFAQNTGFSGKKIDRKSVV